MVEQRETYRGDAEYAPLHGRAHGARVDVVDGGVGAVVDAREQKVGLAVENGVHGHFHAVHRGAGDAEHLRAVNRGVALDFKRGVDGEGR